MRAVNRPEIALIVLGEAIVVAVLSAFAFNACSQHEAALDSARRSAASYANIVGEHTARSFEAADRTLREVELIRSNFRNGRYASERALKEALQHLQRTSPIIVAVGWTDAAGNLEAHSYPGDAPRPSIAGMKHFTIQRDAMQDQLFVSPPFESAAAPGRWFTAISRRLTDENGAFAGIVTAPIDLSYFVQIYKAVDLVGQGAVVLGHHDSRMIMAREPPLQSEADRSYANRTSSLDRELSHSDAGVYTVRNPFDGRDRIIGYRAVKGSPLVAMITMPTDDVLQAWRSQMVTNGAVVALLIAVIALGLIVVLRQARRLSEQTDLLSAALDNMDQGLITVASDDRIVLYNQRALDLLGLPEELMARRPSSGEVLAYQAATGEFAQVSDDVRARVRPSVVRGEPAFYERVRPNGTALEIRTVPFTDGGVVRTYTDVTARQAVKEALRREKEHAEAATRAKSEFLATMSHELRTPLTAIIGVSELLMSGNVPAEHRQRYLAMQRDAGRGLLQVVNDVLDNAKIEAGQLRIEHAPFELRQLIAGCVDLFGASAEQKGLRLDLHLDPNLPKLVSGDSMRLRQVLMNLISNALKFTEKGSVQVSVAAGAAATGGVSFSVRDTGIGIESARLPELFERFAQGDSSTARRFGGSGLGLAISRELVALMGGMLAVESCPGEGSTFSFSVPLTSSEPVRAPTVPGEAAAPARVLLVEDSATNRELVAAMLRQAGHDVATAASGHDATAMAARERFDVILMDIQMPGIDGYAAARLIASTPGASQRAPVIALTASALPAEIERSRIAGMKAHIAKPIDWASLNSAIASVVAAGGESPGTGRAALAVLAGRIGADPVARLLRLFVAEARAFLADSDGEPLSGASIAEQAHSLSGSAGMLGFDGLHDACRTLEEVARKGGAIDRAVARARAERARALDAADRWLAETVATSGRLSA